MTRVQSKLPTIARDANNDQTRSKYSRHETISKAIKPIYTAEGFALSFSEEDSPKEDHIRIVGILRHSAGYSERHHLDVPLDISGLKGNTNKTKTHATGSTYSYGRRYLTCMIFDVATGDDNDGNQPIEYITKEQAKQIRDMLKKTKSDESAFCKYMMTKSVDAIRASEFNRAMAALKKKESK
jgi:hypothetical protein